MVLSHPSVAALLYHRGREAFLLVRQFRPAVYVSAVRAAEAEGEPVPPLSVGFTYELCVSVAATALPHWGTPHTLCLSTRRPASQPSTLLLSPTPRLSAKHPAS